jgi:hypothetical protein
MRAQHASFLQDVLQENRHKANFLRPATAEGAFGIRLILRPATAKGALCATSKSLQFARILHDAGCLHDAAVPPSVLTK